ncbi:amino acid ABC transporter permease [Variovorax paradoxus]
MKPHHWDFAAVLDNWQILASGLIGTFELALASLLCGTAIGLVVGAARYSARPLLHWPATAYVEFFRNTPVLVQIIWFFFALPILIQVDLSPYVAATLALSLNTGAFMAEIFRGGIRSIHRGQWEAARAVGMTYMQCMRRVILPQAIKRMLPAFTNRAIELFKMTTLASAIAFHEVLYGAKTIAATHFNSIEAYTTVAFIFFGLVYPMVQFLYAIERNLKRGD